jgi:polar amino acid transport system substrate-binding protein
MLKLLRSLCLLVFLVQTCIATSAFAMDTDRVKVCADPDPPPWTYWKRDASGQKSAEFVGFSVDVLNAAFGRIGKTVEFHGELPWSRCLVMVEEGQMDFAMDAYFDADRAKRFAYTTHYNTLTPQIFFRRARPVRVQSLSDLKSLKGCGMNGASYSHYGLNASDLDLGPGYDNMIKKLKAERCDYFVEELEVIAGYKIIGTDYLSDPAIANSPVPLAKAPAKHLITAKNGPWAKLIAPLDNALKAVIKSGEAAASWKLHSGGLAYTP